MSNLHELGYEFLRQINNVFIYVKYLGDNEVTLELDIITGQVEKWVNDFRKKVEIEPDIIEIIVMQNLLYQMNHYYFP